MARHLARKWRLSWIATRLRAVNPYLGGFLTAAIFLGLALVLPERTGPWSAGVILLMAVLASTSIWGLKQGLIVSFLAVAAYDFFFIPPIYTLDISDWQDALSLSIFGLTAATVSVLAESLNGRAVASRRNEILAKRLYAFGQRLRVAQDFATIARETVTSAGVAAGAKALLLLPKAGVLTVAAAHPARALLNQPEIEALRSACERGCRRIGDSVQNDA
jgi:two-component system, OmpR family, sensor histidine kinase KdpD